MLDLGCALASEGLTFFAPDSSDGRMPVEAEGPKPAHGETPHPRLG